MKIAYFFVKKNFLIIFILVSAFLLRVLPTVWGYPPYHSDEGMSYSQGISIIREKTLDANGYPFHYAYPSAIPLINAFFFYFLFIPLWWLKFIIQNSGQIIDGLIRFPLIEAEYGRVFQLFILGEREINVLFWGRVISAMCGVGVVYLTYILAKNLFSRKVGLISSILVAVNYRQVLNSTINLPDVYNAFFLLLSFILSYRIIKKPTFQNYFWAGLLAGIFFSTKFHTYAFYPLVLVHIFVSFRKIDKNILKRFFTPKIIGSFLTAAFITILLNPYHLINFEETKEELAYVARKYQVGRLGIDIYPFTYLFFIGIGKLTSILTIVGVLWGLIKDSRKSILILSIIVTFFYVVTYYTKGGFYTRNFVTITPFLLIFAGYAFSRFTELLFGVQKKGIILTSIFLALIVFENLTNSLAVVSAYVKPWNYKVLSEWVPKNIPDNSFISAHSSVPLPAKGVTRLPYDIPTSFSMNEFAEDGADYAVANLDWVISDFYWWMGTSSIKGTNYYTKPLKILEYTYTALAMREMSDFVIYSVINPWQAPDSNFIVTKIPRYSILEKKQYKTYDFNSEQDLWKKVDVHTKDQSLIHENGMLMIQVGTSFSRTGRWESEPINIENWSAFVIDYKIKTEARDSEIREGFIAAMFYKNEEDARLHKNRVGVRLSGRNRQQSEWINKELVGEIPMESKFMIVSFHSFDPAQARVFLDDVDVYSAKVEANKGDIKPFVLDENVLFPNSHGYL